MLASDLPGTVRVGVLGPLRVTDAAGQQVPISARRHGDLLMLLAVSRQSRSVDAIADMLWRGAPPPSARVTVQGYIARLRRTLGPVDGVAIRTDSSGYRLESDGTTLDVDALDVASTETFEALRRREFAAAVEWSAAALGLWRGDALEGVRDIQEVAADVARLDELRSDLVEAHAAARIASSDGPRAVASLVAHVRRHPLREKGTRLLARALLDDGRPSEALSALATLRTRLRDELGADPDSATADLERLVLRATDERRHTIAAVEIPRPERGADEQSWSGWAVTAAAAQDRPGDVLDVWGRAAQAGEPAETELTSAIDLAVAAVRAARRLGRIESADDALAVGWRWALRKGDHVATARVALVGTPMGVAGYFSGFGATQFGARLPLASAAHELPGVPEPLRRSLAARIAARSAVDGLAVPADVVDAWTAPDAGVDELLAALTALWTPADSHRRAALAVRLERAVLGDRDHARDPTVLATVVHLQRVIATERADMRAVRRHSSEFARLAAGYGSASGDPTGVDVMTMDLWWRVMFALLRGEDAAVRRLVAEASSTVGDRDETAARMIAFSADTSAAIGAWQKGRLIDVLDGLVEQAETVDDDLALPIALAMAEAGRADEALRTLDPILADDRWHGPRIGVRTPLAVEVLAAVGSDPEFRPAASARLVGLEPIVRSWTPGLIVQWPGLICLGPSDLYRGTVLAARGDPRGVEALARAERLAADIGARPYKERARGRLNGWVVDEGHTVGASH